MTLQNDTAEWHFAEWNFAEWFCALCFNKSAMNWTSLCHFHLNPIVRNGELYFGQKKSFKWHELSSLRCNLYTLNLHFSLFNDLTMIMILYHMVAVKRQSLCCIREKMWHAASVFMSMLCGSRSWELLFLLSWCEPVTMLQFLCVVFCEM